MNEILEQLTLKEMGERLLLARKTLGLKQQEVAEIIKTSQTRLSQIEKGNAVTSPVLIRLLAFYSQSISLDALFAENMNFVTHQNLLNKDYALSKIVKEKIECLRISTIYDLKQTTEELDRVFRETSSLL